MPSSHLTWSFLLVSHKHLVLLSFLPIPRASCPSTFLKLNWKSRQPDLLLQKTETQIIRDVAILSYTQNLSCSAGLWQKASEFQLKVKEIHLFTAESSRAPISPISIRIYRLCCESSRVLSDPQATGLGCVTCGTEVFIFYRKQWDFYRIYVWEINTSIFIPSTGDANRWFHLGPAKETKWSGTHRSPQNLSILKWL